MKFYLIGATYYSSVIVKADTLDLAERLAETDETKMALATEFSFAQEPVICEVYEVTEDGIPVDAERKP